MCVCMYCFFLPTINIRKRFLTQAMYAQSKLAQVIFTTTLHKFLTDKSLNIRIYCVHPGLVNTDLFNNSLISKVKFLMNRFKVMTDTKVFFPNLSELSSLINLSKYTFVADT